MVGRFFASKFPIYTLASAVQSPLWELKDWGLRLRNNKAYLSHK